MGAGYSARKERRAKLEKLVEEKRLVPEPIVGSVNKIEEDLNLRKDDQAKPTMPTDRKNDADSKNVKQIGKADHLSNKKPTREGSKKGNKTKSKAQGEEEEHDPENDDNMEEAEEEVPHGEENRREAWEEGEEEGEEEDEGSGEFDELSKMHVPPNMKKYVKYDSQKPSDQQGDSEENSHKTGSHSIKKQISIKTLRNLEKPKDQPSERKKIKRKTFSKKALEEVPSITKSELKKVKIRPFPKPKVIDNKPVPIKEKPKDLTVIKEEEPKPPKEDSFFKNFDASKFDFSKYKESQQSWNKKDDAKQKKDAKILIPEEGPTFLLEEVRVRSHRLGA
jgi:hypothetical protein